MVTNPFVKRVLVWAMILFVFVLAFIVIKPILIAIILGLLMAYVFNPLYELVNRRIGRRNLSAFLFIALLLFLVIAPVLYFAPSLVRETFDTYSSVQNFDLGSFLSQYVSPEVSILLSSNVDNLSGSFFNGLLSEFSSFLSNLPSFLLQVAIFFFTFFYALRDAKPLRDYVSSLSPLSKSTEDRFLKEFRGITNAIVYGQVLIGLVQGLALWVGLFFLGVPRSLILAVIGGILSVIPVLGSWLVWLPASVLLFVSGDSFAGIFLLLYGAVFISNIDNLLRPYLLSKSSQLPVSLSIIGTIGGLYVFGIIGLLLGPLILAYALIILDFYKQGKLEELFHK